MIVLPWLLFDSGWTLCSDIISLFNIIRECFEMKCSFSYVRPACHILPTIKIYFQASTSIDFEVIYENIIQELFNFLEGAFSRYCLLTCYTVGRQSVIYVHETHIFYILYPQTTDFGDIHFFFIFRSVCLLFCGIIFLYEFQLMRKLLFFFNKNLMNLLI